MKLKDGFDSNYRYVLVAARRARQLSGGAPPLVNTAARKPSKIAQEEIDAGKIQFTVKAKEAPAAPVAEPPKAEENT
jgi:DNA-directed RNA polymerase subunit omega